MGRGDADGRHGPPLTLLPQVLPISSGDEDKLVTADLTDLAQDWLDAEVPLPNHGIALVSGGAKIGIDGKEAVHPAELEVIPTLAVGIVTPDKIAPGQTYTFENMNVISNMLVGGVLGVQFDASLIGNADVGAAMTVGTDMAVGDDMTVFGNLSVAGMINKGGGGFEIDHPLDPANKYLVHAFVESPDMKKRP